MFTFRFHITLFFCLLTFIVSSQNNKYGIVFPINRELVITGNYGEIRPNHFHAGIDLSTHPINNLPIKSINDGYVSRIKISRAGYGRVLYITHANGYVSVYAHQKRFSSAIENYVKQKQIEQQKNEIELFLSPNELPIKKSEIIGYTGNSGSSQGPHLHFEIRDEKTEVPYNPLLWYDVQDKTSPTLTHIGIFDLQDKMQLKHLRTATIDLKTKSLVAPKNTLQVTTNKIGIAFVGYDQADNSANKNNIYEAKLYIDGTLIYHHQLDNISFDDARYVNYFGEKIDGQKLQKCFPALCFPNSMYKTLVNNAVIDLQDTLNHLILLEVNDEKNNKNAIRFYVKSNLSYTNALPTIINASCDKDYEIVKDDAIIKVPRGALTRSIFIPVYYNKLGKLVIGNKDEIILKSIQLSIKVNKPLSGKESKMVLINEGNCFTGKYENGFYKTETKQLGFFELAYDTIAPDIQWLNKPKPGKVIKNILQFKITDKLSGIGDYHVYINDVWQIAEFDAKTSTLVCVVDEAKIKSIQKIRVKVVDKVQNEAVFEKVIN